MDFRRGREMGALFNRGRIVEAFAGMGVNRAHIRFWVMVSALVVCFYAVGAGAAEEVARKLPSQTAIVDPVERAKSFHPVPPRQRPPVDCSKATITGAQLLDKIHAIAMHGDLTDIPFIERTLETKFEVKHESFDVGKEKPVRRDVYSSNFLFGLPIRVSVGLELGREHQLDINSIALMRFMDPEVFHDCLGIESSDFDAKFGKKFLRRVVTSDLGTISASANMPNVGRDGASLYVAYSYGTYGVRDGVDDEIVDRVSIGQRP